MSTTNNINEILPTNVLNCNNQKLQKTCIEINDAPIPHASGTPTSTISSRDCLLSFTNASIFARTKSWNLFNRHKRVEILNHN